VKGTVDYCIKRALKFGEYADMIWMETPTPDLQVAKEFSEGVFAENPNLMLSYNLSPSFNWEASGLNDQ
jgi:isocitrate lyase